MTTTTAQASIKTRKSGRDHYLVGAQGSIVADIYGKPSTGFTVIVRALVADLLTGPRVATLPTLDAAVASFAERWSA